LVDAAGTEGKFLRFRIADLGYDGKVKGPPIEFEVFVPQELLTKDYLAPEKEKNEYEVFSRLPELPDEEFFATHRALRMLHNYMLFASEQVNKTELKQVGWLSLMGDYSDERRYPTASFAKQKIEDQVRFLTQALPLLEDRSCCFAALFLDKLISKPKATQPPEILEAFSIPYLLEYHESYLVEVRRT